MKWIFHELFKHTSTKTGAPKEALDHFIHYSKLAFEDLYKELSSREEGLTHAEVVERLKEHGLNEVISEKSLHWYDILIKNILNPFVILLLFLGLLSLFLGNFASLIIILVMVLLGVLMRFVQEWRSNLAAQKLKALVSTKATVIRESHKEGNSISHKKEISFKHLVVGDIITLSAGDMIPADVRLLHATDLFVNQSTLTGEAAPVEKETRVIENFTSSRMIDFPNICFMGTNVISGIGKAIVIATGNQTYFGMIAKSILGRRHKTSFDIGITKVSWLLIACVFAIVPLVFFINALTKGNILEALLFALSVAVGLTPELLPMIVTANLARGAVNMSKHKVIVKQLSSIQNFGAIDILCTDKTGTLTQDKIILEHYLNLMGEEDSHILEMAYLNSYHQTGLKNLLDRAILEHKELEKSLSSTYTKIEEIPFDFERKRMTVVVSKEHEPYKMISKGSLETILSICKYAEIDHKKESIHEALVNKIRHLHDHLNDQGLRVLAMATKEIDQSRGSHFTVKDEFDLSLRGFLVFLDPPKQSAAKAIQTLKEDGIAIKVITGDNEVITKRIATWVGLSIQGILTGPEMSLLNEENLKELILRTTIFARITPLQKAQIIRILKEQGHTVGYLGDGVNDAPALREADVGISVDHAVDIAKESSDIIMLEKSLLFLGQGVIEGRKTFGNIMKYIKMVLSSNFGNVFSVVGASILLPFLPMMPIQILLQNLLYDISQLGIPFDSLDPEYLKVPRAWNPKGILRFMFFLGPVSSLFDYVTFAILWFIFHANSIANQSLFQSGWFLEGLFSQTLIVHMIRTEKMPFIQSRSAKVLVFLTIIVMAIGLLIPFSFIGEKMGMTSLPYGYFPYLIAILIGYVLTTQVVKNIYIKWFRSWI